VFTTSLRKSIASLSSLKKAKEWAQKAINNGNKEAELLFKKYDLQKY